MQAMTKTTRILRIGVAILVLLIALPAIAATLPPGGTFTDDNGNTHEGNIEAIAGGGVTSGCNVDGTLYCPSDDVTRGQMASFLARAFSLPPATKDWFPDDDGTTHEDNINRIADAGITTGFSDGTYDPNGHVTRAQMGSFIARAMGLAPIPGDTFPDVDGVHEANINAIADAGVTLGCGGGFYCPNDNVRRDQMASFLARALGLDPIDVPPPTTTTTTTTVPAVTFGNGTHLVPSEVPAGLYRNSSSSGGCYAERLSGLGGTFDEIIANEFTFELLLVEIDGSEVAFSSDDCGTWTDKITARANPSSPFGGGHYRIGEDVTPGTWRNSDSSSGCYWERLSGFSWGFGDIIANSFSTSIETVSISASDVGFWSEDCGTWTKIG